MKYILIIVALLFLVKGVNGQTIFDIEVDQLYLDEERLIFINKGEIATYTCEVIPIKQKDFIYKMVLECDSYLKLSKDSILLNYNDIIQFKEPTKFNEWLEDKKFAREPSDGYEKHTSFIQLFSEHLFAELDYINYEEEKPVWVFQDADFWDYAYVRINKEFLIIALIDRDDADIRGYIIPTKDGGIVVSRLHYHYPQKGKIDSIDLTKYIRTEDYFRIAKEGEYYKVYDKLFKEDILKSKFSRVKSGDNFNIVTADKGATIYNKTFDKVIQKNVQVAYDSLRITQLIKDDKIKWIDKDGKMQDTFPPAQWLVCGNYSLTNRQIQKYGNNFMELREKDDGSMSGDIKKDSIKILVKPEIKEVKYLNDDTIHKFDDYSKLSAVFSFPYNYYCFFTKDSQKIVQITNKIDSLKGRLLWQREYSGDKNINKDSLTQIINRLQDDIDIKVIFEGNLEVKGYYHPIKFKENGLYGYFPQNKSAKYKKVEDFNFFFASFELPNGKEGWLDIYGNEYLKK